MAANNPPITENKYSPTKIKLIFILFVIISFLVAFVAGGFLLGRGNNTGTKNGGLNLQIAGIACPEGAVFTKIPINSSKILSVTPLGNLNPPDHTTPTDHIYLVVKPNNEIHKEFATVVFAPSDITISQITRQTIKQNGRVVNEDYAIDFMPCRDIQAKFGHVTKLSQKLADLAQQNKSDCQTRIPRPSDEYSYCRINLNNTKIPSGEEIGEAGGGSATGLDFWAMDFRKKALNFANPSRYSDYQLHTACAVDLFDDTSKETLSQKFGRYEKKRIQEPLCGQFNQDVLGTLQGNWTGGDGLIDMPEAWSKSLSLIHDNVDPKIGVVSIGGTISVPSKIQFAPASTGTTNREFSEIKDEQIYCYRGESIGINSRLTGRILIQLIGPSKLKAEYQDTDCGQPLRFNSPTLYQR